LSHVEGYLEIFPKGFGFLRDIENNYRPSRGDTFVPAHQIRNIDLREGLYIEGVAEKNQKDKKQNAQLNKITSINQNTPEYYKSVQELKSLTSINPNERIRLAMDEDDRMGKILDTIVPLGKGQRGLIIASPKTGKTTILKHIALAIEKNHPEIELFILLVDERPEEVTDFKRA